MSTSFPTDEPQGGDSDSPAENFGALDPQLLVLLGQFREERRAREFSLVLRALEIPHQVQPSNVGFSLVVRNENFDRAQAELNLYHSENIDWPPKEAPIQAGAFWVQGTVLYAALILLIFFFERGDAFGFDWRSAGRVDGALMRGGEWLRAASALTLHADLMHLVSNMTYGALFGALVAYGLGGGVAWLAILLGGIFGNILNVLVQGEGHRSIGASTAVFPAVGVLAGSEVVRRHLLRQRRIRRAAPLLVAFLLLSYLGMGGAENPDQSVDVTAHAAGLAAGFVIGAPLGRMPASLSQDRRVQLLAGASCSLILCVSWLVLL